MATKGPKLNSVAVAKWIGRQYVETDTHKFEGHQITEEIYREIAEITAELFDKIPVPVEFQPKDPYDSYTDMAETVGHEQKLRVYSKHNDHEYFSEKENMKFRAVHDWFGHLEADVDFSAEGEFKKWEHMNQYYKTEDQKRVMFGEVVGQLGAIHYLKDSFNDDRYTQRAIPAPLTWIRLMDNAVN